MKGNDTSIATLRKIAEAHGKPVWWLLTGENQVRKNTDDGTNSFGPANISPGPPILSRVPVISWVQAGDWSEAVDPFQPGFAEEWIDTTATKHPNAFALVVHGDSMEPEFIEGEIITVDPGRDAVNGAYVIAKNGNEATFKQLVLDGSSVFLKPLNARYPIKDMTGIEFRIIGVVVAKEKRY